MTKVKKHITLDPITEQAIREVAKENGMSFSEALNRMAIYGLEKFMKLYGKKEECKIENQQSAESPFEKVRKEYWRRVLFDWENAELYGWVEMECRW